nr:hypothetical protein [Tanacetum cinerariifolium]
MAVGPNKGPPSSLGMEKVVGVLPFLDAAGSVHSSSVGKTFGIRVKETSLKFFDFNTSSLQERRTVSDVRYEHVAMNLVSQLESGTFTSIFKYPALKQLAIKWEDEYGIVIRPCLVGVTFESVRIDM